MTKIPAGAWSSVRKGSEQGSIQWSPAKLVSPFGQFCGKLNVESAPAAYVDLTKKQGLSPANLALAFVRRRRFLTSTVIGASSLALLKEDIDVIDIDRPVAVLPEIDPIHQRYPNPAL